MIVEIVGTVLSSAITSLFSSPIFGSAWVAVMTQLFKDFPVGPSQGPGIRLFAAVLSLLMAGLKIASNGQVDPSEVGSAFIEAVVSFLLATGIWKVAQKT